jgi:hypothetical protein
MIQTLANLRKQEGRALRPFFVCCMAILLSGVSMSAAQEAKARSGRIRPPALVTCDRNHLTSWSGRVSGYRRDSEQTWLEISTDEDTVEQTTVQNEGKPDASAHFLLWGESFAEQDWSKIESAEGVLIDGMRAVAWVCDDGVTAPVVDWQPAQE